MSFSAQSCTYFGILTYPRFQFMQPLAIYSLKGCSCFILALITNYELFLCRRHVENDNKQREIQKKKEQEGKWTINRFKSQEKKK
jgi:hypothetical protein